MIAGLSSLECRAFGVPFRLNADSGDLLAEMQRCVPFGAQVGVAWDGTARDFTMVSKPDPGNYRLLAGDRSVAEGEALEVLDHLTSELMLHVADHAADRIFVHAGVIGWQGHALILPGISFAGKTTLVAELVRAGASYYSDEYAVLDEDGNVHPYARDLQVREVDGAQQRPVSVELLDGRAGSMPLPVSHVVFTKYVEGGLWNPRPVSAGLVALKMMRHAIPVQREPARVMATLAKMMETAEGSRSERGEARDTARLLLAAMDRN